MAEPRVSTCAVWATESDLCEPCSQTVIDSFPAGLLDTSLQIASDLLYEWSGRQFPGVCSATVRPCAQQTIRNADPDYPSNAISNGADCSCQVASKCGCSRLHAIRLGAEPVIDITQVRIDGAIIPASEYRIDEHRWLVRLPDTNDDNDGWPCCQRLDLPATEDETFEVQFTYGRTPLPAGVHAAAVLACELALACSPDSSLCRLPVRAQQITRQGITIGFIDPSSFLITRQGQSVRTGIREVDMFLSAYAPSGPRIRSQVFSPDLVRRGARQDT